MTDLRTRIAATLSAHLCQQQGRPGEKQWLNTASLADAVIRELGLHREVALTFEGHTNRISDYRYVTDWESDDAV